LIKIVGYTYGVKDDKMFNLVVGKRENLNCEYLFIYLEYNFPN